MGRAFGFLGTVITLAAGMYFYSLQVKTLGPSASSTPNNEEAVIITGVKGDLISIAKAEQAYMASEGKYASLETLVSGNYLTIKGERPPYIYDVQITSNTFSATATRTTKGAPAMLWVTENMEMQSSN